MKTIWALLCATLCVAVACAMKPEPVRPMAGVASGLRVYLPDTLSSVREASRFSTGPGDPFDDPADAMKRAQPFREAVAGALFKAGFQVVSNPREPKDLVAELETVLYADGAIQTATISLRSDGKVVDTASFQGEGSSCSTGGRLSCEPPQASALLINALTSSGRMLEWARARSPSPETGAAAAIARAAPPAAAPPAAAAAPPVPTTPARAEQALALAVAAPQPTTYALIVGIEKYRDAPPPTGARTDAERFAAVMRKTYGVSEDHVIVALDDRAAKSDIEKHLDWLKGNATAGSRVIFFFSGHGAPEPTKGTSYLLPYDGDPRFLDRTALPMGQVLLALSQTKAREVVAFVDTCFSGAGGRSVLPPGARPLVRVQQPNVATTVAVYSAAQGSEISGPAPGGSMGLFTHHLVTALGQGGADINGDGQVSLYELDEYVRPRVVRDAKRDNRDQTPTLLLGTGVADPRAFMMGWGYGRP